MGGARSAANFRGNGPGLSALLLATMALAGVEQPHWNLLLALKIIGSLPQIATSRVSLAKNSPTVESPQQCPESVQFSGSQLTPPAVSSTSPPLCGSLSHLLMASCAGGLGMLAVVISRSGHAVEKAGQSLGLLSKTSVPHIDKARPLPPSKLGDLAPVRLDRPLLFVPGFQTPQDRFDHMTEKLTENGLNGGRVYYVKEDRVYSDKECRQEIRQADPEARVYVAVFSSTKDSPPVTAGDLKSSLDRISQGSGQKVDVVAYSMGGLATRTYLDRGGDRVGKLMMVGTPNHGSALAALSLGALNLEAQGKEVSWLLAKGPKALSQHDRGALSSLTTHQGQDNDFLAQINSRWSQQRERIEEVLIVGSGEQHTLGHNFQLSKGDATVPTESLAIDHTTPVVLLDDKSRGRHGLLLSNPNLYHEMTRFFQWDKLS